MRIRSGATGFCVTAAVAAMATAGFAWPAVLMGWGMSTLVMLALVATGVLGRPLSAAISAVYSRMLPIVQGALRLVYHLFYAG